MKHRKALFVTGTDTDVGKTVVSAWVCLHWQAHYWKPIQSGTADGTDAQTLSRLAPDGVIHPPAYTLSQPLSPHEAAHRDGITLNLGRIHPPAAPRLVVEGAGGVMVPLNHHDLMLDLMVALDLPVLLVARSGLGTINHTLLSLMALRQRGLTLLGVVLCGPPNPPNRRAVEHFGSIAVVAEIPPLDPLDTRALAALPAPTFLDALP